MQRIELRTDDSVTIIGDYHPATPGTAHGDKAALFLHAMPATRASWSALAERLAADGFATLAIDLRGHGESTAGPAGVVLDRNAFSDEQHKEKMRDVEASVRWLMEKGTVPTKIALVGASIGANLAIAYAGAHEETPAVVALSPGLEYHGVRTEEAARAMPRAQKLLMAASNEDTYAFDSARTLAQLNENAELQEHAGAGHGTALLENVPGFLDYVVFWIENNVK